MVFFGFLGFLVQLGATWSQLEAHLVAKKLHVAGLAGLVGLVGLARLAGLAGLAGLGSQEIQSTLKREGKTFIRGRYYKLQINTSAGNKSTI